MPRAPEVITSSSVPVPRAPEVITSTSVPVPSAPEVIASTTVVLKRQLRRFVLLDLLNAESPPERYRRGPTSQEIRRGGGEGGWVGGWGGTNYT